MVWIHGGGFVIGGGSQRIYDGTLFTLQLPIRRPLGFRLLVRKYAGEFADRILSAFPVRTRDDVRSSTANLLTVGAFLAPTRRFARALIDQGARAWLYQFTRVRATLGSRGLGATHGAELMYVFGTMPQGLEKSNVDDTVAAAMHEAWLRFAKTGDPNGNGLTDWPLYTRESAVTMVFGDRTTTGTLPWRDACDLFDEISLRRGPAGGMTGE
jgi:para-nitrobenzyl esterase